MSNIRWRGRGPEFELSWCGLNWHLHLDGPRPGLALDGSEQALLLSLEGLSVRGRSCHWQTERPRLTKFDSLFDRVEATYAFPAWGGLTVRASWSHVPELDGVDLEIQILADSVDYLKDVEVQVVTEFRDPEYTGTVSSAVDVVVEPRDRESAALSYDGREPSEILHRLSTLPVPSPNDTGFEPKVVETPSLGEGFRYLEFVHPDDVARRLVSRSSLANSASGAETRIRYGIFGHDLEKGVLLRSRMRGVWAKGPVSRDELAARFREFREGPLPLGP